MKARAIVLALRVRAVTLALLLGGTLAALAADQPANTNNANSCDIAVTPAATLLLPYFEVDTAAATGTGATTLFTITNTSRYPQIAHVTLWTDWAFPVAGFNVLLTGYDVHGINLYDVIVYGILAPSSAASAVPFVHATNPNFATGKLSAQATCAGLRRVLPPDLIAAVRNALTTGTGYTVGGVNCSGPVGANHGRIAKGYVTIDVVSHCSSRLPTDQGGAYFQGASAPILFDNVLIGDYQQIGPGPAGSDASTTFDARGGPMVHIRAIPEGGLSGASGGVPVATNLPFTFYDRYTPAEARTADRRQPLPSTWNVRYIQGGFNRFATDFKIWLEGVTAGLPNCSSGGTVRNNSVLAIPFPIRYDEHENATGIGWGNCILGCTTNVWMPTTSRTATTSSLFPPRTTTDLGGWMFLNLSSGAQHASPVGQRVFDATLTAQRAGLGPFAPDTIGSRTITQSWVVVSMFGAVGSVRLTTDFDAAWLGNGCTPAVEPPYGMSIGPASHRAGVLVCPGNTAKCGPATQPPTANP